MRFRSTRYGRTPAHPPQHSLWRTAIQRKTYLPLPSPSRKPLPKNALRRRKPLPQPRNSPTIFENRSEKNHINRLPRHVLFPLQRMNASGLLVVLLLSLLTRPSHALVNDEHLIETDVYMGDFWVRTVAVVVLVLGVIADLNLYTIWHRLENATPSAPEEPRNQPDVFQYINSPIQPQSYSSPPPPPLSFQKQTPFRTVLSNGFVR